MQTPRRLPVQLEPVGLSNLFDSLRVNERQIKQVQGLLRNTPALGYREIEGAEKAGMSKT